MTASTLTLLSEVRCFDGWLKRYSHPSSSCHCDMTFSVYLPPQAEDKVVPVLYWLSGLTCTDENFMVKSGAQRYAAEHGIAIIAPDTSPRGEDVPDDPDGAWDFGLGAGFYLNATQKPWSTHYHMYDYITEELPKLLKENFPVDSQRQSISGHSMGGHGALTIALKNPGRFSSVSAFAPIANPLQCPWGEKAFSHYLGDNREQWATYDSCHLIKHCPEEQARQLTLLVDQGLGDCFISEQLKPEALEQVCGEKGVDLTLRLHEDYDHSYYFIASFIGEHIKFHAKHLIGSAS
ncbi:S-formylglutathione hydrolase [Alkalimarinus coralli]|uniref:S-formylglutathione hydrolase n=1 Tax=Alkalimarinus coralli TaxID=2935863 RepID=UPI00202B4601|nr:S-formylglutathione hydrolase [Alkalimarinus coralli]